MSASSGKSPAVAAGGSVLFNVYGFEVEVRSVSATALDGLAADFSYFRLPEARHPFVIELFEESPPYDAVPPAVATVYTPRNISFREGELTYIDYFGRALAIHHRRIGHLRIYSRDSDLLYEAAYLFLLSQLTEFLDARHLHRVHALAISVAGRAALVLLPMGGGKSTLATELLKYPEVKLLSDDSPLIDRQGRVHCFPVRLGVLPGSEGAIPQHELRRINRMEFGPKLLVNYSYFSARVCPSADPDVVFLGARSLVPTCQILPAGRAESIRSMMANCVVGLGLFQGMEFIFQRSPRELAGKAGVVWSRWRNSLALLRRSRSYRLILGRDIQENGRTVIEFLRAR